MEDDVPQEHRALVVDDHEDTLEMLAMLLRRHAYVVETASSAVEAIERFEGGETFCVVVSDIGMPRMNGYELARSLRKRAECRKTVIIAITGFSVYGDRQRALDAGFDDLITKPISTAGFLATIERHRRRK